MDKNVRGMMNQKLGLLSLILIGLMPILGIQIDFTLAIVALVVAAVIAIYSIVKENSWLAKSTITLAVLYISLYISWLLLKYKMNQLLGGMLGLQ